MQGQLFVISAASGTGKTSMVKALCAHHERLKRAISYTTRAPRSKEIDGVDYYFATDGVFQQLIQANGFFEYAQVFDHWYGTPIKEVMTMLNNGFDVLVDIDWQGAALLKQAYPYVTTLFILPPSMEALRSRLSNRGQDVQSVVDARMALAASEISHAKAYDYWVINDDFSQAISECEAIIKSARYKRAYQAKQHADLLASFVQ